MMVSAIRPEAPQIKYPNRSGLGTRGNEQRLTIDVTPSTRLKYLRQGLRMPGHASYSTLGYPPGHPVSTSLAIKIARVPLRVDPSFQVTGVKSKYPCVQTSRGKPEESPPMNSTRCNHQGERKRNHPRGSHLRGCTTESYRKWLRRNHPR